MADFLSLLDLNNKIKKTLEEGLGESYWVVSEISEMRVNQRGHCYLELVEKKDDEIMAKMRATIWSYAYRNLSRWFEAVTGESLKPGMRILANVTVNFHEVFGLSLNIRDIDANYTVGERARRRQEILNRLREDGIAEMNKELPLPLVPQRIAIIASESSAGYQDFIDQLAQNTYGYHFFTSIFPSTMQGKDAAKSIIHSMVEINRIIDRYDLLVIIRGGGATLDLDCFDNYELASHVAQFPKPIITGIGHERDETITDIVANTRLKTPTAVAEFVISGCRQFEEKVEELFLSVVETSEYRLTGQQNNIDRYVQEIKHRSNFLLSKRENIQHQITQKFILTTENKLKEIQSFISRSKKTVVRSSSIVLENLENNLRSVESKIQLLDPEKILARGFSITRKNNTVVKHPVELDPDDIIDTELSSGNIKSKIIK